MSNTNPYISETASNFVTEFSGLGNQAKSQVNGLLASVDWNITNNKNKTLLVIPNDYTIVITGFAFCLVYGHLDPSVDAMYVSIEDVDTGGDLLEVLKNHMTNYGLLSACNNGDGLADFAYRNTYFPVTITDLVNNRLSSILTPTGKTLRVALDATSEGLNDWVRFQLYGFYVPNVPNP